MDARVTRPTGRDEILDAVLDAAERLFAESGPTQVSLRTIAREAGVTYGLVHRHFGTKEQLIEQLLRRYAERWLVQMQTLTGYEDALEYLFGSGPETGAYLRLLAWTLLSGDDGSPTDAHRRHALLDRLPAMRVASGAADTAGDSGDGTNATGAARDATLKTAAALAFVFGWRFFNPFIRAALHLDGDDPAVIHEAMRAELRSMLSSGRPEPS
ncbi:MAG TPA: helix-turn-helix domain-containing protein [Acidimicrobiales bacterium]